MNFKDGEIRWDEVYHISVERFDMAKEIQLKTDDVLMTKDGTIGKLLYIDKIPYPNKASLNSHLLVFRPIRNSYSPKFLYYQLASKSFKDYIELNKSGTTFFGISQESVGGYDVFLPPIAEQEAIAEALSDTDALIESLEQLIAKKRQVKQGAMQELLTGKRRLPKFEIRQGYKQTEIGMIPEDWNVHEIGNILKSTQLGGNYKNSERETNWPLIKMGNLRRGIINIEKLEFIDSCQSPAIKDRLRKDDLLFNTRNTLDLVGKVAIWREELPEAYFNSNIMRMEFDEELISSKHFMNSILNTSQALKSLRGIAIGTTSVAAIYSRDLMKMLIPVPTLAEQIAIAAVLSDMDAEIAELERKLKKSRRVKQGMMQELLTGKIRLV
jgi:type I restriction enzyme S subunit